MSTIYALSTPPGRSAVAVVRVSGPAAGAALEALTGQPPPPPRQARVRTLRTPAGGGAGARGGARGGADGGLDVLDRALVLFFAAPASVTGDDVAEFQVHGGQAVVAALLDALAAVPGLMPAEPGAFTRRAFANGRLDLTAVEGLADLIAAETQAQRRQALRVAGGALTRLCRAWRGGLVRCLGHLEAEIDFAEDIAGTEDGIGTPARQAMETPARQATETLAHLAGQMRSHVARGECGERLRTGLAVFVLGSPNAGKSTIINRLTGRDVAMVSARPGTTRDVLEAPLDLGGYPVLLLDGAGATDCHPADALDAEGQRRALARAQEADMRLIVLAPDAPLASAALAARQPGDMVVRNKADLNPGGAQPGSGASIAADHCISARTGQGWDSWLAAFTGAVAQRCGAGESALITRARQRQALRDCAAACARAAGVLEAGGGVELAAEDVRLAARALERLAGRVDVEDVLDAIFSEFCIGK